MRGILRRQQRVCTRKGQPIKIMKILEVLSEARGRSLGDKVDAGQVAARMKAHKDWFGPKFVEAVAKKDKVSYVDLEKMFPDFIPGRVIISLIGK